jgi:hypothetical protein
MFKNFMTFYSVDTKEYNEAVTGNQEFRAMMKPILKKF